MTRPMLSLGIAVALGFLLTPRVTGQELERVAAPDGALVYIIAPSSGEPVASPVKVQFGLSGMGVAPAGVEVANIGHHHLLIDTGLPPLDAAIPNDAKHRHFGGGQTETTLELAPGRHTLQLLVADHRHVAHDPPVASEVVTITVR